MLGLQNEREWAVFCESVLAQPELARDDRFSTNSRRSAARAELHAVIVDVFSRLTSEEVLRRLDHAQIANAHMNDMRDLWEHPQLKARGRWTGIASPSGALPALLPPGMAEANMGPVPALGEHTDAILTELGYAREAIDRLRSEGAV
jgi:itaconate CoA-transferase